MSQRVRTSDVKLPGHEEPIAPVTILDEQGRVVRVVQASEFRRAATTHTGRTGGGRPSGSRAEGRAPCPAPSAFLRKADGMTPRPADEASQAVGSSLHFTRWRQRMNSRMALRVSRCRARASTAACSGTTSTPLGSAARPGSAAARYARPRAGRIQTGPASLRRTRAAQQMCARHDSRWRLLRVDGMWKPSVRRASARRRRARRIRRTRASAVARHHAPQISLSFLGASMQYGPHRRPRSDDFTPEVPHG